MILLMSKKYNVNKFFTNVLETESITIEELDIRLRQTRLLDWLETNPIVTNENIKSFSIEDIDLLIHSLENLTVSEVNNFNHYIRSIDKNNPVVDATAVNHAKDYITDIPKIPIIDSLDYF